MAKEGILQMLWLYLKRGAVYAILLVVIIAALGFFLGPIAAANLIDNWAELLSVTGIWILVSLIISGWLMTWVIGRKEVNEWMA